MEFVRSAAGLTRNPLGIIALFISLIYGMSALLLGVIISNLEKSNQTALVYFIISFPVVVLAVFGWLVSRHHSKLYGPGDYRTDESFITAGRTPTPIAVGQRLREEVRDEIRPENSALEATSDGLLMVIDVGAPSSDAGVSSYDTSASAQEATAPPNTDQVPSSSSSPENRLREIIFGSGNVDDKLSRAFAAQNLALQELQADFGLAVARSVVIADNKIVDGLIVTPNGYVIAEVKYVRSFNNFHKILVIGAMQLMSHINSLKSHNTPLVKAILLIVLEENLTKESLNRIYDLTDKQRTRFPEIDIKIMRFSMLAEKYGLSGI